METRLRTSPDTELKASVWEEEVPDYSDYQLGWLSRRTRELEEENEALKERMEKAERTLTYIGVLVVIGLGVTLITMLRNTGLL